jgi:hypothetical protein
MPDADQPSGAGGESRPPEAAIRLAERWATTTRRWDRAGLSYRVVSAEPKESSEQIQ